MSTAKRGCNSSFPSEHCVEFIPYKSGFVRFKYPGQPWQEIAGDDFRLEQVSTPGQDYSGEYRIGGTFVSKTTRFSAAPCNSISYWATSATVLGRIIDVNLPVNQSSKVTVFFQTEPGGKIKQIDLSIRWSISDNFNPSSRLISYTAQNDCFSTRGRLYGTDLKFTDIVRVDGGEDETNGCVFKVLKNEQEIFSRTSEVCPEAQVVPCELDYAKAEKHSAKTSYLGFLRANTVYSTFDGLLVEIPPECIFVEVINTSFGFTQTPTLQPNNDYIAQVCSAKGCPRPEVNFYCDQPCEEKCPEGTCAVECDGHICCYNDQGIAIKEISR